MVSKNTLLFALSILFSCANALNITEILSQYKDLSAFNDLLTRTQLAPEINSHNTITVLAVDNSVIGALLGTPADVVKKVLSVHIVLDYYDLVKLQKVPNKTATLTTLFQSSGHATGQQGFLKAKVASSGVVVLSSEAPGSPPGANVVKTIVSQPYNVSVLQVSHAIVPMGITVSNSSSNSTLPPSSSLAPSTGPVKYPPITSPMKSPPNASPRISPATTPATSPNEAPTPSDEAADGPQAAAPSTPPVVANEPNADAPVADAADSKEKSAAVELGLGASRIFVVIASLILSLASMI